MSEQLERAREREACGRWIDVPTTLKRSGVGTSVDENRVAKLDFGSTGRNCRSSAQLSSDQLRSAQLCCVRPCVPCVVLGSAPVYPEFWSFSPAGTH
eukprot:scaffold1272_cov250-Pinguiococcus_pyrenoidosus.AAC.62